MDQVLRIVNLVLKILAIVVLSIATLLSLFTAYIVLAPDQLPKPFRLVYDYGNGPVVGLSSGVAATSAPVVPHGAEVVAPDAKPGEGHMVNMSTKIINLSDPAGRKYIRLTVVLEFALDAEAIKAAEEAKKSSGGEGGAAVTADPFDARINAQMPLMDDVVIITLSNKSYEELYTANGKEALRNEIRDAINKRLPAFHVISVYFTEFVVQ